MMMPRLSEIWRSKRSTSVSLMFSVKLQLLQGLDDEDNSVQVLSCDNLLLLVPVSNPCADVAQPSVSCCPLSTLPVGNMETPKRKVAITADTA
ncbi:hypothetical protein BC826DRAFT_987420 [Russula brevipes]|nr:hypothetical protein BC826DRAFT_987420 [Russula brevipes]